MMYLFSEDYCKIPGLEGFLDVEAVERHAERKLAAWGNPYADLYLTGGRQTAG